MTQVKLLTKAQASLIHGEPISQTHGIVGNVIEDADGNSIISLEQARSCTLENLWWALSLPEIEFNPIQIEPEL